MEEIKERQKLSWQGMFYSMQRIDLLIVSISGAGIYVCLQSVKYFSEKNQNISIILKIAGVLFLLAIIANFLSQKFGYKANEQDFLMCQTKLDSIKSPTIEDEEEIKKYDLSAEKYSNLTNKLNNWSIGLMLVGLTSLMVYFLFIF